MSNLDLINGVIEFSLFNFFFTGSWWFENRLYTRRWLTALSVSCPCLLCVRIYRKTCQLHYQSTFERMSLSIHFLASIIDFKLKDNNKCVYGKILLANCYFRIITLYQLSTTIINMELIVLRLVPLKVFCYPIPFYRKGFQHHQLHIHMRDSWDQFRKLHLRL